VKYIFHSSFSSSSSHVFQGEKGAKGVVGMFFSSMAFPYSIKSIKKIINYLSYEIIKIFIPLIEYQNFVCPLPESVLRTAVKYELITVTFLSFWNKFLILDSFSNTIGVKNTLLGRFWAAAFFVLA